MAAVVVDFFKCALSRAGVAGRCGAVLSPNAVWAPYIVFGAYIDPPLHT